MFASLWQKLAQTAVSSDEQLMLGLMSGTSLDGLDIALVALKPPPAWPKLAAFKTYPYPKTLRAEIISAMSHGKAAQISHLDFKLGQWYAKRVLSFFKKFSIAPPALLAIASHGQTVYHHHRQASLQIGNADCIALATGLPVVFDFRSRDIALGGAGAPLIPYYDRYLIAEQSKVYALQNLGGIGNVTFGGGGNRFSGF